MQLEEASWPASRGTLTPPGRGSYSAALHYGGASTSSFTLHLTTSTMRQRITYLQDPAAAIDPSILIVTPSSISTPQLKAAKEERITFGLDELPQELYRVLKESHELHIRWVSETPFETRAPLVARLSPGLHVFWTALRERADSYVYF